MICRNCKSVNNEDHLYCWKCGELLPRSQSSQEELSPLKGQLKVQNLDLRKKWVYIPLGVVGIIVIVVVAWIFIKSIDNGAQSDRVLPTPTIKNPQQSSEVSKSESVRIPDDTWVDDSGISIQLKNPTFNMECGGNFGFELIIKNQSGYDITEETWAIAPVIDDDVGTGSDFYSSAAQWSIGKLCDGQEYQPLEQMKLPVLLNGGQLELSIMIISSGATPPTKYLVSVEDKTWEIPLPKSLESPCDVAGWELLPVGVAEGQPDQGWKTVQLGLGFYNNSRYWGGVISFFGIDTSQWLLVTEDGYTYQPDLSAINLPNRIPPGFAVLGTGYWSQANSNTKWAMLTYIVAESQKKYTIKHPDINIGCYYPNGSQWGEIIEDGTIDFNNPNQIAPVSDKALSRLDQPIDLGIGTLTYLGNNTGEYGSEVSFYFTNASRGYQARAILKCYVLSGGIVYDGTCGIDAGPGQTMEVRFSFPINNLVGSYLILVNEISVEFDPNGNRTIKYNRANVVLKIPESSTSH